MEYYRRGGIEVWSFIRDQNLDFHLGNAIKYICRAGYKGGQAKKCEDLEKAIAKLEEEKAVGAAKLTNGAVEKVPTGAKLISGGAIAAEGLGYLHKGEEVLEAAEISRIERALAGQTLNAQMMERQGAGGEAAGMGSAPIIMDNSTVVQNNHQSTFTNPIGQMLPNEASNFVSKMAA